MRPMILDEFGNQAQLAEGTLSVNLVKPDGSDTPLGLVTTHVKGSSLPYYEIKTETQIAGEHSVHVLLNGNAISGSLLFSQYRVVPRSRAKRARSTR